MFSPCVPSFPLCCTSPCRSHCDHSFFFGPVCAMRHFPMECPPSHFDKPGVILSPSFFPRRFPPFLTIRRLAAKRICDPPLAFRGVKARFPKHGVGPNPSLIFSLSFSSLLSQGAGIPPLDSSMLKQGFFPLVSFSLFLPTPTLTDPSPYGEGTIPSPLSLLLDPPLLFRKVSNHRVWVFFPFFLTVYFYLPPRLSPGGRFLDPCSPVLSRAFSLIHSLRAPTGPVWLRRGPRLLDPVNFFLPHAEPFPFATM